jgi:hypothetical protein
MTKARRSLVVRGVLALGGCSLLFVGLIGFAHTSAGRPLLAFLPGFGATCPVGMDKQLAPEERESVRAESLELLRGDATARTRPAMGFRLGETSRAETRAWASQYGISCEDDKRGEGLRCAHVPGASVAAEQDVDDLLFLFDTTDRLIAVDASRRGLDADAAAALVDRRSGQLHEETGTIPIRSGSTTGPYLASAPLRRASVEVRCSDYHAEVSATNLGQGRLVVREAYRAIPN